MHFPGGPLCYSASCSWAAAAAACWLGGGVLVDAAAPRIQRRRARGIPQSGLDARRPAFADLLARARRGDAGHDAAGAAAGAPGA